MKIGKVCVKHPELNGERDDSSACRACRAARAKAWGKKYRADNAVKLAERRAAWYAKNRGKALEYSRRYKENNPDDPAVAADYNKAYRERNATELREKSRQYRARNAERIRADYAANRDKRLEQMRKSRAANADARRRYREAHKAEALESVNRRRAAKLLATPVWANRFFIREAYALAKLREKVCGGKWHVDHIVPLRSELVCGLHVEHNLQVIPAAVNTAKHNRYWPDMP